MFPASWRRSIAFLFRHARLTFLLMGAFFLLFGFCSVNLFVVLKANIDLFLEYGAMVIDDGALQQFVEILGSCYLSMLFYVGFKLCERILTERLIGKPLREEKEAHHRHDDPQHRSSAPANGPSPVE
jgi:hypothetical protein